MWRILSDLASVLAGLTANRLVRTNASKQLESNAALTATRVLYVDANGWPTDSANMTFDGSKVTVASANVSGLTASRLLRTDASKNLESNAALTNTRVLYADSNGWPTDSANLTFSGTLLTLGTGATSGLTIAATTGTTLTVSSAQDSTSKDTGSIVTEGGLGVEKAVNVGTTLSIGTSFTETATQAPFRMEQTLTDTQCGGMSVRPTYTPAAGNSNQSRALGVTWTVNASAGDLTASLPNAVVRAVTSVTGGNITALAGLTSFLNHTGSGTITNWYGLNVQTPANSGGGTITNNYAIKIFSPSAGTNRLGLDIDNVSGGSVNYAIRTGTGLVSIGDTTDSTSKDTGSIVTEGGIGVEKSLYAGNSILSVGATNGIGYATGAGGTVTQITSRTTGVTLNKVCGEITLVSAAGSATWQSFTVTNSAMAATDNVVVNQKSGTDLYMIHVTAKAAGSFRISFATTGGTTSEQPVFGFSIIKSVAA